MTKCSRENPCERVDECPDCAEYLTPVKPPTQTRYVALFAVEIDADRISDVDDVAMATALERFPGVVSVHGGGVVERDEGDDDRTVWADVLDSIQP